MKLNRQNCEIYLCTTLGRIDLEGIHTADELLNRADLCAMLMQALNAWGLFVACSQGTVASVCETAGLSRQEMLSDWVAHVFRSGTREKNSYPTLSGLMNVNAKDGAKSAVAYLMSSARNFALDVERKHDVRRSRAGEVMGFDASDEWGVIDPGESRDVNSENAEEIVQRKHAMESLFSMMGERFLGDVAILAGALGYNRRVVADLLFAGRQVELVMAMRQQISQRMHQDYSRTFEPLLAQARAFVLPERLHSDYDALLAALYRETSTGARQRFRQRYERRVAGE